MPLKTTCIGAYPKPSYLPIRDWFSVDNGMTGQGAEVTRAYTAALAGWNDADEEKFRRATRQAVQDQVLCGIDIPTDGEQKRENYIHYHCRHLEGFDFANLTHKVVRDGAYATELPTVVGPIKPMGHHFLTVDYEMAQSTTDRPVKITVPGALTVMDTVADEHYGDRAQLARDIAEALNFEILALAEAGCTHIQIDEPLFARNVEDALAFGIECLQRAFFRVPGAVTRTVHMCCGYPDHLDDTEYHKADPAAYFELADAMEKAEIDALSIEDAHRHNDFSLLERFRHTTIILGAVAIAKSEVESIDEIADRLRQALEHIDAERLIAAPDCGLGLLGRKLAMAKLSNMCAAAKRV